MLTDDTHIFVSDANVDKVDDHLNSELERIHQWLSLVRISTSGR